MTEIAFNGLYYYVTKNLQNFTQAQTTCHRNSSEIANLKALDFEKFVEKMEKVEGFMYNNVLRVQPINNTIKNCFGVFELLWINVDEGVSGNVNDVCKGQRRFDNGMYKTLCSKITKQPSLNSSSSSDKSPSDAVDPIIAIVVTLVVIGIVGTLIVLFFYFKRKRRTKLMQKSSVCRIELVESSKEVRNSYFLTV